jgi:hypothetical protein
MPSIPQDVKSAAEGALAGATGTTSLPNPGSILGGLGDIGHFFDLLASGALWIRVAEVILGAGLIIVGLATLVSGPAGRAATRAGKAAAIL